MISQFENFLKKVINTLSKEALEPLTIEELNSRISKSEEDFENGRFKTTSEELTKY